MATSKKNVGGRAKLITESMAQRSDALERAFEMGFRSGLDAAERVEKLPVVTCPMCRMAQELDDAKARLRVLENMPRRGSGHHFG